MGKKSKIMMLAVLGATAALTHGATMKQKPVMKNLAEIAQGGDRQGAGKPEGAVARPGAQE